MKTASQLLWEGIENKIKDWQARPFVVEYDLADFLERTREQLQIMEFTEAEQLTEKFLLFLDRTGTKRWEKSEWRPLLRQIQTEFPLHSVQRRTGFPTRSYRCCLSLTMIFSSSLL
ncbi:hypothetical protein [Salimicrobium jeotgali]|uniref:hypothetical protein n=1 Tax=Salimicrobium jeotgali TaxID=1230341 RepID=UPI000C839040|nr:hypothetical protein [Salimicrobium jeotgali]